MSSPFSARRATSRRVSPARIISSTVTIPCARRASLARTCSAVGDLAPIRCLSPMSPEVRPRCGANLGSVPTLREPWTLAGYELPNRLVLAPLAGIGNWFVRLQAKRFGAGLAVSEMVSSFGLKYGDDRTHREFLRIHPDEHPVSIQLFGHDPDVMRIAAAITAEKGADMIDLNMGCPVRKVCKTGAGASLLDDPDKAVAIARAAKEGSGLPVTVKLRSGNRPGERTGAHLARRLEQDAGVAGITFHPRHAQQQHKGEPDYALTAELVDELEIPVIVSGGISDEERALHAFETTGAAAVMLAR